MSLHMLYPQIFRKNTRYIPVPKKTSIFNHKYRVFPRHFYQVTCDCACAYHKYFKKIPDILQCVKRPENLAANIGYFPDIFYQVTCDCACAYHKYFRKMPDILHVFWNALRHCQFKHILPDISDLYPQTLENFTKAQTMQTHAYLLPVVWCWNQNESNICLTAVTSITKSSDNSIQY